MAGYNTKGFHALSTEPQCATYAWTNGTVEASQTAAPWGVALHSVKPEYSSGVSFTAKAGRDAREILIFSGGFDCDVQLTATLASGASVTDTWNGVPGKWRNGYYVIAFTGASDNDVLTITLENLTPSQGNLTLQAAALRPVP